MFIIQSISKMIANIILCCLQVHSIQKLRVQRILGVVLLILYTKHKNCLDGYCKRTGILNFIFQLIPNT